MKKTDARSWITILFIILVSAGIAIAGSQGSVRIAGIPLFAVCVAMAFLIQWIVFIPSFVNRTEQYFDLTGSITYIAISLIAILLSPELDWRRLLLAGLIIFWAGRLGTFLFKRVQEAGEDRRFKEIRKSFSRFLMTWTLQGLWVTLTAGAALAAITSEHNTGWDIFALIGLIIWVIGFLIEVIADKQKREFCANSANKGKFINTGLWSWSRHPNYFGEIVLWIGIAVISFPVLQRWQRLTLISPVFVAFLLTKISGVPILEKMADEKWGGQENYQQYKKITSVLIPLPPRESNK